MSNINLHPGQSKVFYDLFVKKDHRFSVVSAARGWGKSYFASACGSNAIMELLELDGSIPNKNVYLVAPTYDQVTDIYWPILSYDFNLDSFAIKSSRDVGRFIFPRNVELRLVSYEAIERLRGKGAYFAVLDEVSSWKQPKEAWESIIEPVIRTRWSEQNARKYGAKSPGRSLTISTPKGYNFFYDMHNFHERDSDWKSYHFDYRSSPYLDIKELEKVKNNIDPQRWASEYLASFVDSSNNVFYCFDRKVHVRNDLDPFYVPSNGRSGETIHVAIDFNVGVMASGIFAIRGGQMHFLDEMSGYPDTETLATGLTNKYKGHKIVAYPDPSGKARKTSAPIGRTDFTILESYGIKVNVKHKAPPIIDSVNAVNRKLMTANGVSSIFIAPHCKNLIMSLERTKWVDRDPNTATIDKSEGIEHFSDGLRYAVDYLFPIHNVGSRAVRGIMF